jgi:hypothetical protein
LLLTVCLFDFRLKWGALHSIPFTVNLVLFKTYLSKHIEETHLLQCLSKCQGNTSFRF